MSETNLAEKMKESASDDYDRLIDGVDDVEEVEEAEEVEEVAETEEVVEDVEENKEPDVVPEVEEVEETEEVPAETVEQEEIPPELQNAPTTYRAHAKEQWDTLPTWMKEEAHKRERDMLNGVNSYKEKAEFGERISKTMHPYKEYLERVNVPIEKAVDEALNLSQTLATSTPQERGILIRNLATMYGADMSVLQQEVDPAQQEVLRLKQQLSSFQRQQMNNQYESAEQQNQSLQAEINSFAEEVDGSGKLIRPYFENVKGLMASLIETGQAEDLNSAYDIAVKAHPDTSAIFTSEQMGKVSAERQEANRKKADQVKKASKVNLDTSPTTEGSKPLGTMRETAEAVFDKLNL